MLARVRLEHAIHHRDDHSPLIGGPTSVSIDGSAPASTSTCWRLRPTSSMGSGRGSGSQEHLAKGEHRDGEEDPAKQMDQGLASHSL